MSQNRVRRVTSGLQCSVLALGCQDTAASQGLITVDQALFTCSRSGRRSTPVKRSVDDARLNVALDVSVVLDAHHLQARAVLQENDPSGKIVVCISVQVGVVSVARGDPSLAALKEPLLLTRMHMRATKQSMNHSCAHMSRPAPNARGTARTSLILLLWSTPASNTHAYACTLHKELGTAALTCRPRRQRRAAPRGSP